MAALLFLSFWGASFLGVGYYQNAVTDFERGGKVPALAPHWPPSVYSPCAVYVKGLYAVRVSLVHMGGGGCVPFSFDHRQNQ